MKIKYITILSITFLTLSSFAAVEGFSDDFSGVSLDTSTFTINDNANPDGHAVGQANGVYEMTDAHGDSNAEIYRSYWNDSDTSGSFDASVKFNVDLPGDEQSDVKWIFKGKEADGGDQIEIKMFTPSRKIKIHQRTGGNWYTLLPDTDVGYTSGDDLTLNLSYDSSSSNITITAQVDVGSEQELYNGTGNGSGVANIIADRNSVVVGKWGNTSTNQATLQVDEWSLTPANNSGGGDGSGSGAGDGSGGNNGGNNEPSFNLAFSDDFDDGSLDTGTFTINDAQNPGGHIGEAAGVYQMTDEQGDSAAEIYKSYWNESDTSGSFEASLTYQVTLPGNEQSDVKWIFKGKDADGGDQVEVKMFTPTRKVKVSHKPNGGGWSDLISDTDIGYSSDDTLTLSLLYNEASSNITVTAQVNSGSEQELYSGTGSGSGVANIIADRNSVSVSKWGSASLESLPTLSIDSWSIQSYTPVVYPDGWGDTDGDGINDAIEALFGGDTSDPSDALTVFAAVTNGSGGSGLTVQEALQATEDARANSMSVSVVDGSATIQLSMETSSNLVEWSSSTNVNVSMPVNEDKQFFRFSFE